MNEGKGMWMIGRFLAALCYCVSNLSSELRIHNSFPINTIHHWLLLMRRLLLCPMLSSCIYFLLSHSHSVSVSVWSICFLSVYKRHRISINHVVSSRIPVDFKLDWHFPSVQGPIGLDGPKGEPVSERMINEMKGTRNGLNNLFVD